MSRMPRAVPYSTAMETPADNAAARPSAGAAFLARYEPFKELDPDERERIAAAMTTRKVAKGEVVLVEGGEVGQELYVVSKGTFDLEHQGVTIAVMDRGRMFGHPTLLTGEPPEFTTRALEDAAVYCIPPDIGLEVLGRPAGVRFVARGLRARLIDAARTMRALPDVRTRTVASLLHHPPVFCAPETSIADAAALMAAQHITALLVEARDGLGIVTDVDLRDKVVALRASVEGPVSSIMSRPVHTVPSDTLAPEASIAMIEAGVNHLPVVDDQGRVAGVLSASSLMSLDSLSPFALRHAILHARSADDVATASAQVPRLFVDLLDAHLDAAALMRILTLLNDAQATRLLELFADEQGEPPVPYAWLAFGSTARGELTLASDQDNGLAFADTRRPGRARLLPPHGAGRQRRAGALRVRRRPARSGREPRRVAPLVLAVARGVRRLPARHRPRPAGHRRDHLRPPPGGRRARHRAAAADHRPAGAAVRPLPQRACRTSPPTSACRSAWAAAWPGRST